MNPDMKMAPRGDDTGWLRQLLHGAARESRQRAANPYPDAVAGSSDPSRRRRSLGEGGPGVIRRWRAEDGSLHRRRCEAGPGAVLATVEI